MKSFLALIFFLGTLIPTPLEAANCPVKLGNGDGSTITWTCPRRISPGQYFAAQNKVIAILNDYGPNPLRVTRWEQDTSDGPGRGYAYLDDYPTGPMNNGDFRLFPTNNAAWETTLFIWCPWPQQGYPIGIVGTPEFNTGCQ